MSSYAIRVDFRSDTVTRPSIGMRKAMADAEVGDDVFGDDFTVKRLETEVATMLGKKAGVFFPSGTQSNLAAIVSHCQRGEEYICGQEAHAYLWEAGGAAVLGSVQPQPLRNDPDGTIPLNCIEKAIKADDPHFAISRLITIENTIGGKVLSLEYMEGVVELARRRGLLVHLDGARIFNAATALNVDAALIAKLFDTVSVCLSKGLGAPIGSVLVGGEEVVARARRWRKMLGGGMRQSGIIAAAGLYALQNNIRRLSEDHKNAELLGRLLSHIDGIAVSTPQTNMVFVDLHSAKAKSLPGELRKMGIAASVLPGGDRMRWVTHLDISTRDVEDTAANVGRVIAHAA